MPHGTAFLDEMPKPTAFQFVSRIFNAVLQVTLLVVRLFCCDFVVILQVNFPVVRLFGAQN